MRAQEALGENHEKILQPAVIELIAALAAGRGGMQDTQ